jgi:hypothetical protein
VASDARSNRVTTGEPVLGWRLWKLEDGCLASLMADHRWEPGETRARCLTLNHAVCRESPGQRCLCGLWAVWSVKQTLTMACLGKEPPWYVMGLIAGWGTVAMHGTEGFRAERAAVRCLFTDRPWHGSPRPMRRLAALRSAGARHAVPLLPLREAIEIGLLGELGLPDDMIAEAADLDARYSNPAAWWF